MEDLEIYNSGAQSFSGNQRAIQRTKGSDERKKHEAYPAEDVVHRKPRGVRDLAGVWPSRPRAVVARMW